MDRADEPSLGAAGRARLVVHADSRLARDPAAGRLRDLIARRFAVWAETEVD